MFWRPSDASSLELTFTFQRHVRRKGCEPFRKTRHSDLCNRVSDEMTQMGSVDETEWFTFYLTAELAEISAVERTGAVKVWKQPLFALWTHSAPVHTHTNMHLTKPPVVKYVYEVTARKNMLFPEDGYDHLNIGKPMLLYTLPPVYSYQPIHFSILTKKYTKTARLFATKKFRTNCCVKWKLNFFIFDPKNDSFITQRLGYSLFDPKLKIIIIMHNHSKDSGHLILSHLRIIVNCKKTNVSIEIICQLTCYILAHLM